MEEGKVVGLFIGPVDEGPIEIRESVVAVAGRGLEGDRYFQPEEESERDATEEVTLFESEGIEMGRSESGIDIRPEDMRRNIMTQGVHLRGLIAKTFWIGEVQLEGLEDNPPCRHLQGLAGKALLKPMIERGGIRARILQGGSVATGDPIRADAGSLG
jgi:MOSC domain-containing protein YiiM